MADTPIDDPYKRLELERDAKSAAIKRAHRSKIKALHPDYLPKTATAEERDRAAVEFNLVQAAYDLLSDPVRRRKYDETGEVDTDASSSGHERALAKIAETFFTLVEGEEFPETIDLMAKIREEIRAQQVSVANSTHLTRQKMRKYQRVRNRIHTQREDDPLTRGCNEIIEGMQRHLENFTEEREVLELSLKLSNEFDFDWIVDNIRNYRDDVRKEALLDARLLALPGAAAAN